MVSGIVRDVKDIVWCPLGMSTVQLSSILFGDTMVPNTE